MLIVFRGGHSLSLLDPTKGMVERVSAGQIFAITMQHAESTA